MNTLPEKKFTEDERDMFAMNFLVWYTHSEDAQIYKSQTHSVFEMLEIYKNRPYLRTDAPQSN